MNNKEYFVELLKRTKREGNEQLVQWLENKGFFESPSSSKFHGAYEGGLLKHSINVFELFKQLVKEHQLALFEDNIIICGLLHDVCKAGMYIPGRLGYSFNPQFKGAGHANLSIDIIEKYMKLLDLEKEIIRYHMGVYGTIEPIAEYSLQDMINAFRDNRVKFFHHCDEKAAQLIEAGGQ